MTSNIDHGKYMRDAWHAWTDLAWHKGGYLVNIHIPVMTIQVTNSWIQTYPTRGASLSTRINSIIYGTTSFGCVKLNLHIFIKMRHQFTERRFRNISFFYLATSKSLMCRGVKIYYLSTSNNVKDLSFHFQATSERPLMTECFCQNWNLGDF